jgi:hypothetical protein
MQTDTTQLDALLAQLRHVGDDPPRALFDQILAHGQEAVQPLIALATDDMLYLLDEDVPEIYAPYHAVRLLGELGAAEAVSPLVLLVGKDDDYLAQHLPECLARIGEPAIEPLQSLLFEPEAELFVATGAATTLTKMAELHPALRNQIVDIMIERLEADNDAGDAAELRAFITSDLADIRATEAMPTIQRLFDEQRIDESIIDLSTTRALIGRPDGVSDLEVIDKLRAVESVVDRHHVPADVLPTAHLTPSGQRYVGPKIGRNERCPCGSGKKFKRCCGA